MSATLKNLRKALKPAGQAFDKAGQAVAAAVKATGTAIQDGAKTINIDAQINDLRREADTKVSLIEAHAKKIEENATFGKEVQDSVEPVSTKRDKEQEEFEGATNYSQNIWDIYAQLAKTSKEVFAANKTIQEIKKASEDNAKIEDKNAKHQRAVVSGATENSKGKVEAAKTIASDAVAKLSSYEQEIAKLRNDSDRALATLQTAVKAFNDLNQNLQTQLAAREKAAAEAAAQRKTAEDERAAERERLQKQMAAIQQKLDALNTASIEGSAGVQNGGAAAVPPLTPALNAQRQADSKVPVAAAAAAAPAPTGLVNK